MADGCYEVEQLAEIAVLSEGDARRAHLTHCPRCRARLAEYESFLRFPSEVAGADVQDADRRLAEVLATEIASRARCSDASFLGRIAARVSLPRSYRAWGVAAVVVIAGVITLSLLGRHSGERVLRGHAPASGTSAVTLLAPEKMADQIVLRWRKQSQADAYIIRLYHADLTDLARFGPIIDTVLVLHAGEVAGLAPADAVLGWSVSALRGGDEIAASPIDPLRVP